MFIYQEQTNSELLVIQVDLGEYVMTYHHMELDGKELISFTQNRPPTEDEYAYLDQLLQQQYDKYNVRNFFRDYVDYCINQGELQITRVRN